MLLKFFLDMYLLHWPICPTAVENQKAFLAETWKALEDCYKEGMLTMDLFTSHFTTKGKQNKRTKNRESFFARKTGTGGVCLLLPH